MIGYEVLERSRPDRIVHQLGAAMLYLGWACVVAGGWGSFFKFVGFVPLLTGLVGFCPIYALLKVRTSKAA
jgi:hypothetical protein